PILLMRPHLLSTLPIVCAVTTQAQPAPTARFINSPDAVSARTLGLPAAVRQLPDGRLLVNDAQRRQLLLFDPRLSAMIVVADSGSNSATSYGARAGGIIPYLGDSTLFVDPAGLSMLVITPSGTIGRIASVPRSQDAAGLAN